MALTKRKHVATGRPVGRPPGAVDAPLPKGMTKTTTTKTSYERTDTPTTQGIIEALKSVSSSPLPRWLEKMYGVSGVEDICIEKTVRNKTPEVGKIKPGDVEPDKAPVYFIENWGEGEYHLRILHEGDYVGTRRTLLVGGVESVEHERTRGQRAALEDAKADIAEVAQALALQAQLETLKRATKGGEDEEMKPEQLLMLANAMKTPPAPAPDFAPILTMMEASRREAAERAEKMEARNHEMQMEMLRVAREDKTNGASTGLTALTALLPHASGLLENPLVKGIVSKFFARAPEPSGGWTPDALMGIVNTVMSAAGPYLGPLIQQIMTPKAAPESPAPALPPTLPAPNGGSSPMARNEIMEALLTELRAPKDDHDYPALESFLDTVPWITGGTVLGLFHSLAATKDHLARVSLGQIDPRLVDAETWPGVLAFLGYLRAEAEKATQTEGAE